MLSTSRTQLRVASLDRAEPNHPDSSQVAQTIVQSLRLTHCIISCVANEAQLNRSRWLVNMAPEYLGRSLDLSHSTAENLVHHVCNSTSFSGSRLRGVEDF